MAVIKKHKKKEEVVVVERKKQTSSQEIADLEYEIANTKYNKATENAIGLLKAKLARLKEKQIDQVQKSKSKSGVAYSVRKTGDGTVIIIGFPSVGKSTILNALTGSKSEVAAYEFTTLDVVPGVLNYKHALIQVLDVPGIVHGAAAGTGRGTEVLSVIRSADLVLFIIDATRPQHYEAILKEVYDSGIRIDQRKPDVKIVKKAKDGLKIGATVKLTKINFDIIKSIMKEFKINNADIVIRTDITVEQFIDALEGNKKYLPSIKIINKIDLVSEEQLDKLKHIIKPQLCINANDKNYLDDLKELIYQKLGIISVYCKEVSKKADKEVPLILFKNATIEDMCNKLHREFVSKFKFAKVWGPSAKFDGQVLMLKHVLKDGDIVELHVR